MKQRNFLIPAVFLCLNFAFGQSPPQGELRTQRPREAREAGRAMTEVRPAEKKPSRGPSAGLGYKGVVMADINPENSFKDEIVVDFGDLGIWIYEQMVWHQISGENPDWVQAAALDGSPGAEVVVDFGTRGLWRWARSGYPGDWRQVSGNDALWAVTLDDDGDGRQELHVNFGPDSGLWRYDEAAGGDGSWMQVSNLAPAWGYRANASPSGKEEGCYLFPTTGVWTIHWSGNEAVYRQLTGDVDSRGVFASADFIGSGGGDLALDFGDKGIWLCQGQDLNWYQISAKIPFKMKTLRSGPGGARLIIDFKDGRGLFVWSVAGYPGRLMRFHHTDPDAGFCEPFDPDGRGEKTGEQELAIDFGKSGLWKYDFSRRTWTLLNTKNPEFMVAGDYWNEGSQAALAVDFGTDGLWLYEGRFGGWFKISANSPDEK